MKYINDWIGEHNNIIAIVLMILTVGVNWQKLRSMDIILSEKISLNVIEIAKIDRSNKVLACEISDNKIENKEQNIKISGILGSVGKLDETLTKSNIVLGKLEVVVDKYMPQIDKNSSDIVDLRIKAGG